MGSNNQGKDTTTVAADGTLQNNEERRNEGVITTVQSKYALMTHNVATHTTGSLRIM